MVHRGEWLSGTTVADGRLVQTKQNLHNTEYKYKYKCS